MNALSLLLSVSLLLRSTICTRLTSVNTMFRVIAAWLCSISPPRRPCNNWKRIWNEAGKKTRAKTPWATVFFVCSFFSHTVFVPHFFCFFFHSTVYSFIKWILMWILRFRFVFCSSLLFALLISGVRVSVVCIYGLFLFAASHLFLRFIATTNTSEKYDCLRSTSTSFQRSHSSELPVDLVSFFSALKYRTKKKRITVFTLQNRESVSVWLLMGRTARFMWRVASSSVPSFPYSFAAWLTLYFTISILVAAAWTFFFRALNRNENEPVFGCFFFGARKVHLSSHRHSTKRTWIVIVGTK